MVPFTRENVLVWAEAGEPSEVLRDVLRRHYQREYGQYSWNELFGVVISGIMNGVEKSLNEKTTNELLDEILKVIKEEEYDIQTMDDFVTWVRDG